MLLCCDVFTASRMEDKSEEIKKEYSKLHDRYTELFKTHMDYMERTKILMGTDRLDQLGASRNRIPGFSLGNLNARHSQSKVEVELLREDNEQLVTQYEREKQLRKASEQQPLWQPDEVFWHDPQWLFRSQVPEDAASRMEDKSEEIKKEYSKLHDKYTELFKTHMDYMERTKILMGTDRLDQLGASRNRIPGFSLGNLNARHSQSKVELMGRAYRRGPCGLGSVRLTPTSPMTWPVDVLGWANGSLQVTSLRNELQVTVV
ncbi:JNK-interacting protein 3 [Chionoecetes opilio]|uniref:JNK-interacting protein 3 n=1 Tax=Chionoecetes opilio TaxID=41210 RepID=A0A8J4YJI5_CHIOP|nr:JNK-interacting protein 3 [Chionoecetes opilio]